MRVADVAQVREGYLTRYGVVTQSGKGEAVEGLVLRVGRRQCTESCARRDAEAGRTQAHLAQGVEIKVFYNRANLVETAVGTVSKALLEATVLVLVLLGPSWATCGPR